MGAIRGRSLRLRGVGAVRGALSFCERATLLVGLLLCNRECAKLLVSFHSEAAGSKLKAVYRKFSSPERASVALFPPAKSLIASMSSA